MEALWRGRTLGKAVMGLRVVRADGGPIGLTQQLAGGSRAARGMGDAGFVGLLTMLVSRRDQRLGDMAAGTLVLPRGR